MVVAVVDGGLMHDRSADLSEAAFGDPTSDCRRAASDPRKYPATVNLVVLRQLT